jgi:predicted nucleotidyltransferase
MEQALEYLIKGDLLKIDIFEACLDHASPEEILEKERTDEKFDSNDYLRYCIINSSMCIVG